MLLTRFVKGTFPGPSGLCFEHDIEIAGNSGASFADGSRGHFLHRQRWVAFPKSSGLTFVGSTAQEGFSEFGRLHAEKSSVGPISKAICVNNERVSNPRAEVTCEGPPPPMWRVPQDVLWT